MHLHATGAPHSRCERYASANPAYATTLHPKASDHAHVRDSIIYEYERSSFLSEWHVAPTYIDRFTFVVQHCVWSTTSASNNAAILLAANAECHARTCEQRACCPTVHAHDLHASRESLSHPPPLMIWKNQERNIALAACMLYDPRIYTCLASAGMCTGSVCVSSFDDNKIYFK